MSNQIEDNSNNQQQISDSRDKESLVMKRHRQREKESMILQRQNVINTQCGLNPISPQSLDVAQLHRMSGPSSQRMDNVGEMLQQQ